MTTLPETEHDRQDVLGEGYLARTITLPPLPDGPARATLVRRASPRPSGRAVLYVHGFADYFFQTELAEFHAARGTDFYAVDLHRYGRSLLPHQTPYDMVDVTEYYAELDAALELIAADGNTVVTVQAHSTGGLITPLWVADRRPAAVDALVLNSPFLEISIDPTLRAVAKVGVDLASRFKPQAAFPLPDGDGYGSSLHRSAHGEWDFDTAWKPLQGNPIRLGWLTAVLRAQARLSTNLGLGMPILVMCSSRSVRSRRWVPEIMTGDAVLNADRIADLSTRLGTHVTCVRIADGLHDLVLSPRPVRDNVYQVMTQWLDRYRVG